MEPTRYPLDFAALRRGSVLSVEAVEVAVGKKRDHPEFPWLHMGLKDQVVQHFEEQGDLGVIVTMCDGGLQVLTDEECAGYCQRESRRTRRRYAWSITKASLIDRAKLQDATRESLDRFLMREAFRLQQMRKAPPPELS